MSSFEADIIVGTALLNMYGKCCSVYDARDCFSHLTHRNVASWTAMITSESDFGCNREVLDLLNLMQLNGIRPDHITFMYAIDACGQMRELQMGHIVNAAIIEANFDSDVFIESAVIVMYGRCGKLCDAECVFHISSRCDIVSWTGILGTFAQCGEGLSGLEYFNRMCLEGICPDKIVLSSAIDACGSLQILNKARQIHTIMLSTFICGFDVQIKNALLNMYGKSGCLHQARILFQSLPNKDIYSWNTIIGACLHNGKEEEALDLFNKMQAEGVEPDSISFIYCLTACSHAGWIEMGKELFWLMIEKHVKQQNFDHHLCMIDLLGRSGHLHEAEYLAKNILLSGKAVLGWLSLLGACKVHGDAQRGLQAAYFCIELDPDNTAPYVLCSNMFHLEP